MRGAEEEGWGGGELKRRRGMGGVAEEGDGGVAEDGDGGVAEEGDGGSS